MCIAIYSCSTRLISFKIRLISEEISRAEQEYTKVHHSTAYIVFELGPHVSYKMSDKVGPKFSCSDFIN